MISPIKQIKSKTERHECVGARWRFHSTFNSRIDRSIFQKNIVTSSKFLCKCVLLLEFFSLEMQRKGFLIRQWTEASPRASPLRAKNKKVKGHETGDEIRGVRVV